MKHLKLFFALFAMLALGATNAWGETVTYQHVFNQKPSTGNSVALSSVNWKIEATALNNYNSNNYAGVQIGSSKSAGSITLTSTTDWDYNGNGKITEVRLWLNTGGSTVTPTVTIGGKSATSDGTTVVKNNGAGSDWTKATKVTFTPVADGNTGVVVINVSTEKAGYICAMEIDCEPASSGGDEPADVIVKTLKSIAVEGMTTDYETGDIFKFDGTCTATYGVTKNDVPQEDETKEVTPTSVSTPDMSTAGEKEVTVTYTEDEVTVTATYTINVTENSIYPGTYALALNNTFFGTAAATSVSAFPTSAKQDDITVTLNGGGTKTRTDADCVRMYDKNTLTFSVPEGYVINSIVFTAGGDWKGSISVNAGTYTNDTKSWAGSAQEVVFSFAAQNRIATATVTYAEAGETPEVPTLDAPTFDLAEGKYNEEQEVTLSAEEGTIYYTLDGTTPDAESIEYTTPIVLEECGEITIKAIAISGEITSSVASATYTIKLPLNNDQANPYTEADAIEVYDGGCYDNQDVYVKGVVANAQFYGSNTYTITLEGGFKFYYFYEAAGEVTFTENYIVAGDTLVACGKLDNYKGTYQLAAGCYLVERKPYSAPKVDISNTPETAYTVAEAMALIDNITSDLTKQVYVKGTVSEIVTEYNATYGNITYNISSDGSTSSPQFQLYRGKSYDGEKFTSADDIKVGDKVVVYGKMKKHNSTYEMDADNQLVALEREDTTTGVDNVETTVAAKKAIINGQLVIVKDGVKFNALGQVIK